MMSSPDDATEKEDMIVEQQEVVEAPMIADLKLDDVTEGKNERGIPMVKFIEDIDTFAKSFDPPASAELLIGAYSDLFAKFKSYEGSLTQKRQHLQNKTPELKKSLDLVKHLKSHAATTTTTAKDDGEPLVTRYSLADAVFGKAEIDTSQRIVNLWLGANVMLEYSYNEASDLLETKLNLAKTELDEVTSDLAFTRNQIITAEVCISRVYNWDIRRKRQLAL